MTPEELKTSIELLQVEYERTTKFIEGVVATSASIRGWTITLTVALLGIAFERQSWPLGVGAIILIVLFGVVDGYHSWLYNEGLKRVQSVEKTLSRYYASLASDGDPDVRRAFDVQLRTHRLGIFVNMPRFTFRGLRYARPRLLLLTLYGTLIAIATVATLVVALTKKSSRSEMSCSVAGTLPAVTINCTTK